MITFFTHFRFSLLGNWYCFSLIHSSGNIPCLRDSLNRSSILPLPRSPRCCMVSLVLLSGPGAFFFLRFVLQYLIQIVSRWMSLCQVMAAGFGACFWFPVWLQQFLPMSTWYCLFFYNIKRKKEVGENIGCLYASVSVNVVFNNQVVLEPLLFIQTFH